MQPLGENLLCTYPKAKAKSLSYLHFKGANQQQWKNMVLMDWLLITNAASCLVYFSFPSSISFKSFYMCSTAKYFPQLLWSCFLKENLRISESANRRGVLTYNNHPTSASLSRFVEWHREMGSLCYWILTQRSQKLLSVGAAWLPSWWHCCLLTLSNRLHLLHI